MGGFPSGEVNDTIGYHVRNLRKKLSKVPSFSVQCTREVGYCIIPYPSEHMVVDEAGNKVVGYPIMSST